MVSLYFVLLFCFLILSSILVKPWKLVTLLTSNKGTKRFEETKVKRNIIESCLIELWQKKFNNYESLILASHSKTKL